eukprot:3657467-Rhodomonas_salina.1
MVGRGERQREREVYSQRVRVLLWRNVAASLRTSRARTRADLAASPPISMPILHKGSCRANSLLLVLRPPPQVQPRRPGGPSCHSRTFSSREEAGNAAATSQAAPNRKSPARAQSDRELETREEGGPVLE